MMTLKYQRVLLKLSGENMGRSGYGIEPSKLKLIVQELKQLLKYGTQVAIVIGAGNIWRKRTHGKGLSGSTADYLGLLATIMNSLALRDALLRENIQVKVQSPIGSDIPRLEPLDVVAARGALRRGQVLIFAGGTGKPFFTTDTAAAQRAVQIKAEVIIKLGPVDGVYSADPRKFKSAKKFKELTLGQAVKYKLQVMDREAFTICRRNRLPIIVAKWQKGSALKAAMGKNTGTLVRP